MCKNRKKNYLKLVLEHGGNPNIGEGWSGYTPLMWAITRGRGTERVELLIKAGVDMDYLNSEGITPLSKSIDYHRFDITLLLLKSGANYKKLHGIGRDGGLQMYTIAHDLAEKRELYFEIEFEPGDDFKEVVAWLKDRNVSLDRAAAQLKSWDKQREKISLRERHIFNNNRKYVEYIEGSDPEEFKKRQQEWKEMQRKVKM